MDDPSCFSVHALHPGTRRPVIVVTGEIDVATAPEFAAEVAVAVATDPLDLVIDLTDASLLDAAGVRVIIWARMHLTAEARIIIRHPQPIVRKVLRITGVDLGCVIEEARWRPPREPARRRALRVSRYAVG